MNPQRGIVCRWLDGRNETGPVVLLAPFSPLRPACRFWWAAWPAGGRIDCPTIVIVGEEVEPVEFLPDYFSPEEAVDLFKAATRYGVVPQACWQSSRLPEAA